MKFLLSYLFSLNLALKVAAGCCTCGPLNPWCCGSKGGGCNFWCCECQGGCNQPWLQNIKQAAFASDFQQTVSSVSKFGEVDIDNSGYITISEYIQYAISVRPDLEDSVSLISTVVEYFNKFDIRGDGKIWLKDIEKSND
ncbi:hypothetical protein TWF694_005069 [Orbilia ellipsospora]|uniref:EF-hand domain-containing protein n=1 Tax=Orbilia ellipsospora TaxID=2528407 RepID=A0AAV9WUI2_9PEZI